MPRFILACVLLLVASCAHKKQETQPFDPGIAAAIHQAVVTMDTHCDIDVLDFTDSVNYTERLSTQVNLPKMEAGGLDVAWFIVYTGQDTLSAGGYEHAKANAMAKFEAIHRLCEVYAPARIGLAMSSEEVRQIHNSGRKVAMIGVENAYPMGEDLGNFQRYYELGARYISLAHNGHSQFADSHTGEADGQWLHNGLSELGQKAVDEMNRLGILNDISHLSKAASMQIMERSGAPVIASHSSARALCGHSRNLDDEQLERLRSNGGVVQTVAFPSYLNTEKHEAHSAFMSGLYRKVADSLGLQWYERGDLADLDDTQWRIYQTNRPLVHSLADSLARKLDGVPPPVSVTDLVDHIDYMVGKIGIDHVGISSDFDGGGGIQGWSDASETLNVTEELVKRGYTQEEIGKLWGENILRVLQRAQLVAQELKDTGPSGD